MSQITTHVLNTMAGIPAKGIAISLQKKDDQNEWSTIASGITNDDGRISNLLDDDQILNSGEYKMLFETKSYFKSQNLECFYPEVAIVFEINNKSHYHIPLLLSPFGYTTYRGS